jgi:microcystin-dependent protein
MAQPYVGEIRMFAGNFAPAGWMFCDGQLLPISENETLFQLIGTTYGGDGESTFALPNLQGRVPVHQGQGPGISQSYILAETGGVETVTITVAQMPNHNHPPQATTNPGGNSPSNAIWAQAGVGLYHPTPGNGDAPMLNTLVQPNGGSQPHDNMAPYLAVNFIISLFGIFPSPT